MKTMHTPGPWIVIGDGFVYALSSRKGRDVNRMNLQVQAGWNGEIRTSDEEVEATARLLAASPELLSALENTQALLERLGMESSDEYQANAVALAKAKGDAS